MTTILATAAGVYALVCLAVWALQARLVWYPGPSPSGTPADAGLAFEDVTIATPDGERLHAWFLPAREGRGVVLVSHGNAGTVENRLDLARTFLAQGRSVLLYDYRGYGNSTGEPSEEGTYVDATSAWDALAARGFPPHSIVSYGESLGGAVAIELARRRAVAAVVVEDTFTSLPDVGARVYPWLPVRWLARVRYDSIAKVPALGAPFLVGHSREDELVPVEHGRRLFAAAREPKEWIETDGGHDGGGIRRRAEWVERLRIFLDAHAPGR